MSLGQIKDYTPNFNFIIPRFDIATWHDYMESNFRSIDALFFNMFGINQYRGEWQNSTTYQVGDVLFIGDPDSQYTGRLVKVLVVHTTTANDSFDVYYAHNPINYDLFMDAAAAEQAAKLARDWAIKTDGKVQGLDYSSKYYANLITPISSEIVNVSNISNEVVNVSNISTNIENVDAISAEIVAVSGKLNEIITNSNNISSININSNNINNIITTATNINSINNVSSISSSVNSVANNIQNVVDVANNETNITTNATNIADIITNATNINNINTVSSNINSILAVDSNKNNINITATNINAVNTAADNIVDIQNASTNAQLAKDWATKMDGLVSGEDYSAKYWADQARQSASGAVVDNISINRNTDDELQTIGVINQNAPTTAIKTWTGTKAQYDAIVSKDRGTLYYLTDVQKIYYGTNLVCENFNRNIANWSSNVTNCITEIPQDIKLELSNGTLTLKAGSKVYIPNGFESDGTTPKFDVVIIGADKTRDWTYSEQGLMFYIHDTNMIHQVPLNSIYSGTTAPTGTLPAPTCWYDTTNNKVKVTSDSGATWIDTYSLPLCLLAANGTQITSIDQVFNGFGYIGSTIFALPGVKGLIPNGRNADGSLKNIEVITDKVTTSTYLSSDTTRRYLIINSVKEIGGYINNIYKKEDNINVDGNGVKQLAYRCGSFNTTSGIISNFTPKTAFHALDYNDSSTISGWSMPSSRYINLTFGASDTTYKAPTNGWFAAVAALARGTGFLELRNYGTADGMIGQYYCWYSTNGIARLVCPAKKGDSVGLRYSGTFDVKYFYFIPSEGEK